MTHFARLAAAIAVAAAVSAAPARGAILTLSVVQGLRLLTGEREIPESISQESLSGSTLTQVGTPALFDPAAGGPLALTVRITNASLADVLFPGFLPGVSVLTHVSGVSGYSSKTNVASGGG
ncbi:MAG TPA: hypothetical protein VID50_12340, partial [Candidatus Eisenbacteria bacterium]